MANNQFPIYLTLGSNAIEIIQNARWICVWNVSGSSRLSNLATPTVFIVIPPVFYIIKADEGNVLDSLKISNGSSTETMVVYF